MNKTYIEYSKTGILPPMVLDYLHEDNKLEQFYDYPPKINSFEKVIQQKQKEKINRKLLVETLTRQYKNIFSTNAANSQEVKQNIELLLNENTFTVCTGHQLNIFTGPLYFLYKIITTINLTEKLTEYHPHFNFIPVYWMASEDHDFEEINHIHLFGKKISWQQSQEGACGRFNPASLAETIDDLQKLIGESPEGKKLVELFKSAYLSNKTLADATRFLVHRLFSKYGLVIIDGDDKALKTEFVAFMRNDLINNTSYKVVNHSISKLNNKYNVQVKPREINLFYLAENVRERIENKNSKFEIRNSKLVFSESEIVNELQNHPENFSPNVVLRPVYQEKILPNLAYIGGPGEISYWLEYKSMFDHYKINFPVLMPRNSVLWLDHNVVSKMNKARITEEDIFKPEDTLVNYFVLKNSGNYISLSHEAEQTEKLFDKIKQKADADQPLMTSIEGEKQKVLSSLKNLEAKLLRSEKKKQETDIQQIKKIKEKVFPENSFQERYDNFIPYYLKHGESFFNTLKESLNPFDFRLAVLSERD